MIDGKDGEERQKKRRKAAERQRETERRERINANRKKKELKIERRGGNKQTEEIRRKILQPRYARTIKNVCGVGKEAAGANYRYFECYFYGAYRAKQAARIR